MKKNFLIIIVICLMACSCVGIFGISYITVSYDLFDSTSTTTLKDDQNKITETVVFSISEEKLANVGLSYSTVTRELSYIISDELNKMYENYIIQVKNGINESIIEKDLELANRYEELLNEVVIYNPTWNGYDFVCKTEFLSSSAYCIFNNITESTFANYEKVKYTFTTRLYFNTESDIVLNQGLYSVINNCIKDKTTLDIENSNYTTSYSYLARSKRYHSNADVVLKTQDGYLHTWNINYNENEEIYFYIRTANRNIWFTIVIIISLMLSIVLTIIALILIIIKRHKKIKNNNKLEQF